MPAPLLKKILIVDDSLFQLKLMEKAFSKEGYHCLKANSGSEALKILSNEQPNLIVSDFEMPDMSGFDFKERLMLNPAFKNIPFLFLTAHSDEEVMMQGLNLKAIDYIVKGTPLPVIVSKVNNLLQTVEQQQQMTIEELRKAAQALNIKSIPDQVPAVAGFDIEFWHKPFENYPGGDFIDFIKVNERYTFILLGDIMGKKWKAWFFTFCFLSYIRAAVRFCVYGNELSTSAILQKINMLVSLDGVLQDILSSLSLVMIDMEANTISYSGAGDLPLVFYNAETSEIKQVTSSGLLLGLMPDGLYDESSFEMKKGDQLLIFSDGIIDYGKQGNHKTDYNLFLQTITPLFGYGESFSMIKKQINFNQPSAIQLDDASIIFIHKN